MTRPQTLSARFCGRPGRLEPVAEGLPEADELWVWRTGDRRVWDLDRPADEGSLLAFACLVAEFYHDRRRFSLRELPGATLEVAWLEFSADGSLLVFFRPVYAPAYAGRIGR